MDRLLPPWLPRSTLPEPSPKIWSPLAPPPSVCPRNPQSTHLGFLGTRVVRQTAPEGRRLQSFPLQHPQSLGRLPSRHQPQGPSPWQRTRSACSCQVARPACSRKPVKLQAPMGLCLVHQLDLFSIVVCLQKNTLEKMFTLGFCWITTPKVIH